MPSPPSPPSPRRRRFAQVDVFTSVSCLGNPVAVVIDSEGLDDATMRRFASWTNLSETVFLLPPTDPSKADYKLRIFTPATELPFAGHPTIGACHVWLGSNGSSADVKRASSNPHEIIQECGVGLVKLLQDPSTSRLRLAAPPLRRSGPVDSETVVRACDSIGLDAKADVLDAKWIDNGPGWFALLLPTAKRVLQAKAGSFEKVKDLNFGIVGPYQGRAREYLEALGRTQVPYEVVEGEPTTESADGPAFEIRAFCPAESVVEDPVTGSLNAGVGMMLRDLGVLRPDQPYVASQGTQLGRAGRVYVQVDEPKKVDGDGDQGQGQVWVGGDVTPCIEGTVML